MRSRRRVYLFALLLSAAPWALGCSNTIASVAGGTVGLTAVGAYVPAHEIEQIYYLGTFDPQGQIPPEFYRLTVRGQASIISNMRFGSGWVPAALVDSLGGRVELPGEGSKGEAAEGSEGRAASANRVDEVDIEEGRGLVQFGPEGFREAPRDHRLVIVMGGDPSAFFEAIDVSLGNIARVQAVQRESTLSRELFARYVALNQRHDQLVTLQQRVESSLSPASAAAP